MTILKKNKFFPILLGNLLVFGLILSAEVKTNSNGERQFCQLPADTSLKLVAANSIIADAVESISGIDIDVIVNGAEDPHTYEPSSSEVSALTEADLIFRLGLSQIEPWWRSEWDDAVVVNLVKDSMVKTDPLISGEDNPHVWMDPNNMISFADDISSALCTADPANSATYKSNAAAYKSKLSGLLDDIESARAVYSGTPVVVNHPAFFYLFQLLEVNRIASIEQGEGKEPSAEDIANIIDEMKDNNVSLIIADPQHNSENVYEISRTTGAKISLLTPLLNVEVTWNGQARTISTYEDLIKYDLWALGNPEDPPSVLDYWWVYLLLGLVIVGLAITFILLRKR